MNATFSSDQDWFAGSEKLFAEMLEAHREMPSTFLEIGSHEGRSAVWMLDNVLTHDDARLLCVDRWRWDEIYRRFLSNVQPYKSRVTALRMVSNEALLHPIVMQHRYDFIYVDGDHTEYHPLEDAVLSFQLLKHGGLMAFDDYRWPDQADKNSNITHLLDAFVSAYDGAITVLHQDYQLWIRKERTP